MKSLLIIMALSLSSALNAQENCTFVKTGTFRFTDNSNTEFTLKRTKSKQVISTENGSISYTLKWISDCKYIIYDRKPALPQNTSEKKNEASDTLTVEINEMDEATSKMVVSDRKHPNASQTYTLTRFTFNTLEHRNKMSIGGASNKGLLNANYQRKLWQYKFLSADVGGGFGWIPGSNGDEENNESASPGFIQFFAGPNLNMIYGRHELSFGMDYSKILRYGTKDNVTQGNYDVVIGNISYVIILDRETGLGFKLSYNPMLYQKGVKENVQDLPVGLAITWKF
ncbi:MAG: hypothetical protein QM710_02305 [Flavobacterium sp.]